MQDGMQDEERKLLRFLGLCKRAGKLCAGGNAVEKSVRGGRSCLVLVASDASGNSRKKCFDMCAYREVPVHIFSTKERLGQALGKEEISSISIEDPGFAEKIRKTVLTVLQGDIQ